MKANIINIKLIIITLIVLLQWSQKKLPKSSCCRDSSRLVRKIVQSKWVPIFRKYHVNIPLECPLHKFRDVFEPREKIKKKDRPTQWSCKRCGKSFFEEKFIDIHIENRHKTIISQSEDSVCFADFCDVMRCEIFLSSENALPFGVSEKITDVEVWGDMNTRNAFLAHSNKLSSVMPHSLTKNQLKKNDYGARDETSSFFTRKLCHSRGMVGDKTVKKQKDHTKEKHQDFLKKEDNVTDKLKVKNGTKIQKHKNVCKTEEISKVKLKCEKLLKTCMTGLLLQMSDTKYKEMEEQLHKAICWFLSCDRYWENGSTDPRLFPWGLILAIIIILSLGICFCYYIIWILFDSTEKKNQMYDNDLLNCYNSAYSHRPLKTSELNDGSSHLDYDNINSSSANDVTNNDHYIYVTYPPELQGRMLDKYE